MRNRQLPTSFTTPLKWIAETVVKALTITSLIIVIWFKADDAAQTLNATFNLSLPEFDLQSANTIDVVIDTPDVVQIEFTPEQLAIIVAAIEGG